MTSTERFESVQPELCEVIVIDDDASVRKSLKRLLTDQGYRVRLYDDPEHFLALDPPPHPSCLLLDNQLSRGVSGVMVHSEILRRGWFLPTVFLTAHWSVKTIIQVIRDGADGFLTKPYDPDELIEAVAKALRTSVLAANEENKRVRISSFADSLTAREKQVVRLVVTGRINKEIADELGIALVTVKLHRGRAMKKLGAGNAAHLARIAAQVGII